MELKQERAVNADDWLKKLRLDRVSGIAESHEAHKGWSQNVRPSALMY